MSDNEQEIAEAEDLVALFGCEVSAVAQFAAQVLRRTGTYTVLCPACGQGECSTFLAHRGFRVTAYETSQRRVTCTVRRAERVGVSIDCFVDDILVPQRRLRQFDAIFSHNALHQLRVTQRRTLLRSFHRALRPGGVLVISVLSTEDERYGYGRQVEEDTFEFAMGELLHFYNASELHEELGQYFDVARVEEMQETESLPGVGKQTYKLLVATALRSG